MCSRDVEFSVFRTIKRKIDQLWEMSKVLGVLQYCILSSQDVLFNIKINKEGVWKSGLWGAQPGQAALRTCRALLSYVLYAVV